MTGIGPITSALPINVPAEIVYAFLAHLPNHERLSDRRLRLVSLATDRLGGRITIRGPLGIRRTVETTVTELRPHVVVGGTATIGRRTAARVLWTIDGRGARSQIALTATITHLGRLDRLLLALGGRRWLAYSFDQAVARLAAALCPVADCPVC